MKTHLLLAGLLFAAVSACAATGEPDAAQDAQTPSLKTVFAKQFTVGVAIDGTRFSEAERNIIFPQFGTVTPANSMKMMVVQPREGQFNFAMADGLVNMVRAKGMTVNGHTLVWHEQCPNWVFDDHGQPAGKELVLARMRAHIAKVAGHFAGKVVSWDVVNEALADSKDGYLRKSQWSDIAGPEFIAEAFKAAHQADPQAKLYYNDYNLETPEKLKKVLRLIHELKAQHVQIDGISDQGHWCLNQTPIKDISAAIDAIHAEGLAFAVSELDIDLFPGHDLDKKKAVVGDPYADGLPPKIAHQLAQQYAQLFAMFAKHPGAISRVTFWGLDDGQSWLNAWPRKRTNHPLLWDRQLQPKEAFWSVVKQAEKK